MPTLSDAGLTSIEILLQNGHKESLELFFFLHSKNVRHQHIWQAQSQL